MKKVVFISLVLSTFLLAATDQRTGTVEKVAKEKVIASAQNAQIGESAVIIATYDQGEIISHSCVVIATDQHSADMHCEPFTHYHQNSMPRIGLQVEAGDKVIFSPLAHTALIIAPSASRYVRTAERFGEYRFVHPDLFALLLKKAKTSNPTIKHFKEFCSNQMIGTLIISLDTSDQIVDCQSFVLLQDHPTVATKEAPMTPFFHRLEGIKDGFFKGSKPIKEYFGYYKALIKKDI